MQVEIKVPQLPESVSEGTLGDWHKQVGDSVAVDELVVELETDKVVLEIVASKAGVIESIEQESGATVKSGDVLGVIDTEGSASAESSADAEKADESKAKSADETDESKAESADESDAPDEAPDEEDSGGAGKASPAVRKLLNEHGLSVDDVKGSGKKGAVLKEDVDKHLRQKQAKGKAPPADKKTAPAAPAPTGARNDRRVPMSRLRSKIAERLKQAQNTAAMLTTFNEVNLKPLMDSRAAYRDAFEKTHGVKLGMMSFFTAASVEALKRFPAVNASIDGDDIVYHDYFDIGIAVSSERGLVVPVLRDADQMSYAEIESSIRDMGVRARDGKLGIEELTGGTFSITNGGIFGSMLSTPILNPPQSAILGMHSIQQRPVVIDDEIVVRPMMYLALTYDHRIVDGKDAVQFLVTIKNVLEDPTRLLLGV